MVKIAVRKDKASSEVKKGSSVAKQTKNQKKKKLWKNHPKIATKEVKAKKPPLPLPPKTAQDYSSNWKALQLLLKPENGSSVTDIASTKVSKKEEEDRVSKKEKEDRVSKKEKEDRVSKKEKEDRVSKKEEEDRVAKKVPLSKTKSTIPKINGAVGESPSVDGKANDAVKETGSIDKRKQKKKRKLNWLDEKPVMEQKRKTSEDSVGEPSKIDIWFDDVDPDDIEAALGPEAGQIARQMQGLPERKADMLDRVLVKDKAFEGLTRTVAMDCEMVGVGVDGEESIVARVSIVNQFGKCVYDKYVKPTERVTDYRTEVSGIRPSDIKNGEDFKIVQKEVSDILKGRILVGHAVHNDLKILFLDHPKKAIRDTQRYKPFKQQVKSGRPSLKLLCETILNVKVQTGEHCSIQDAQAAMRLYTMEKKNWEAAIKAKYTSTKSEPARRKAAPQQSAQ